RASLKLISFTFWIFSFTFAQDQECHRKDITAENIEPLEKETYAHGTTLRINCITGYTGINKYICSDGQWQPVTERKCSKKKCGHPGDTPNGDFTLLDGNTEFVFGATVRYTCKKGYDMANRIYQRTCRNSGWDNAIPVCEVVTCPPIPADEDLTISGNTEEGTYSDVIHFECMSPNKKIDREQNDIYCNEKGEWSLPVPKCIEITCTVSDIPHGTVESNKVYKKDDTLQYDCDAGYKPRQGTPRCNKYGWSLKPECEEITCELKETKYGIQKIKPEGKTFFRAGESVQITCSETHRIFWTKESRKTFYCQNDGQWDNNPTCEEIRCEVPRDRHLYSPSYYFYGNMKLDVKRSYSCLSGYRQMAAVATCTRDGWKPDPLCAENRCETPNIPNAQIVSPERTNYEVASKIEYKCLQGFEPEQPIVITCNSAAIWINIQNCGCVSPERVENAVIISKPQERYSSRSHVTYRCQKNVTMNGDRKVVCHNKIWDKAPTCEAFCSKPLLTVDNAKLIDETQDGRKYPHGDTVRYECDDDFESMGETIAKCDAQTWIYPECIRKAQCTKPTKNLRFVTLLDEKSLYNNFEGLTYRCNEPYDKIPEGTLMCKSEKWIGTIDCTSSICPPPPSIEDGDYNIEVKIDEVITKVSYSCQSYYVPDKAQRFYRCQDGRWETPPKCLKPCEFTPEINEKYNIKPLQDKYVKHSERSFTRDCKNGWMVGSSRGKYSVTVRCSDGKITIDQKYKQRQEDTNAFITTVAVTFMGRDKAVEKVQYESVTREAGREAYILIYLNGTVLIKLHREMTKFHSENLLPTRGAFPEQRHNSLVNHHSTMHHWGNKRSSYDCFPKPVTYECILDACQKPMTEKKGSCTTPNLENGYIHTDSPKEESIYYSCSTRYKPLSGNWWGAATCNNGRWSNEPQCIEENKCGVLPSVQHGHLKETNAGQSAEIVCDPGFKSSQKSIGCHNGRWETPTCEVDEEGCVSPERVENAVIISKPQERYSSRSHVTYKCHRHFTINGNSKVFCRNSAWDKAPTCEAFCSQPLLTVNNAKLMVTQDGRKYSHGDTVRYECDDGFESMGETIAKCDGQTWIYPECITLGVNTFGSSAEITCELKETKYGIQKIKPEGKTFFRAGESVQITCSETHRIFWTKETTKTLYCQNDGQWDNNPTCEEIRCEIPRDSRLYSPSYYFYGIMKLDVKRSYSCLSGYRQMAAVATCTRDGWKPDPLCADTRCEAPNIPNAQIVSPERTNYEVASRIEYKCLPGFEPEQPIVITCNSEAIWINIQSCVEKEGSCTTPILENGYIDRNPPTEDSLFYSCSTGYKPLTGKWWGAATCNNGHWSNEPRCILDEEGCVSPPKVENAVIISKPQEWYSYGSHVIYRCRRHFTITGNSRVSCHNKAWDEAPTCEAFCSKPLLTVNNAKLIDETQDERKYTHGDTVRYECDDDYESMGETIAKCDAQTWIYPECIRKSQCTKPTTNLQFVTLLDEKSLYNNFEGLTYMCNKPYDKIPEGTLMCKSEKWIGTIDCTSSICPPPPLIEDGDYNIEVKIDEVITKVSYSCQSYYVPDKAQRFYRCQDGRWDTPPKCLKPCRFTPEIYMDYNIQPVQYNYLQHTDREIALDCKTGWNAGGFRRLGYVKGTCSDGKMTIHKKCEHMSVFTSHMNDIAVVTLDI
ncbi:complement factor H precursor, partial [Triplophysa rosa]